MANQPKMYLKHNEILALVRDEDWDTLRQPEIKTSRGMVRNSVKSLEGAMEIIETTLVGLPGFSKGNISKFRAIIDEMNQVSTRGRKKTALAVGDTRFVRLLSRQGQASIPFVGDFFEYLGDEESELKNPYKDMYVEVKYLKDKIEVKPIPSEDWEKYKR